ncbi:hypothetical protein GLOTRDRAFT_114365 [Gloeophyllum trabeum ATCC 11539]|uniref:Ribosome assembly protein 3 n=1 Tax=Gloeophyllum trabeum (strain ATCC 11539 / FP-39264 / Madison 617) TaxID=670483 RepID=S7QKL5_GLOTA|nr:uncharacterized protein GLOTRDRAFT_114365 [Gloeophyllum trabeum ATCC 11539]EPQ59793.1 hypothetical protein GLOTRDRAFT_114365 [Gloeophyllum trabeum ATCC 11539]
MPPAKPVQPRKRNRKRKRRVASSSESSSSDSGSSSDESPRIVVRTPAPAKEASETEDSSSSSDSQSESESETQLARSNDNVVEPMDVSERRTSRKVVSRRSPSISPPPTTIPSFPPGAVPGQESLDEQALKEKFRKFWMASIADGFKDDLEVIRKEPNMTTSRLGLLIESLAAGANVFSSSSDRDGINEMEVVLDQNTQS